MMDLIGIRPFINDIASKYLIERFKLRIGFVIESSDGVRSVWGGEGRVACLPERCTLVWEFRALWNPLLPALRNTAEPSLCLSALTSSSRPTLFSSKLRPPLVLGNQFLPCFPSSLPSKQVHRFSTRGSTSKRLKGLAKETVHKHFLAPSLFFLIVAIQTILQYLF